MDLLGLKEAENFCYLIQVSCRPGRLHLGFWYSCIGTRSHTITECTSSRCWNINVTHSVDTESTPDCPVLSHGVGRLSVTSLHCHVHCGNWRLWPHREPLLHILRAQREERFHVFHQLINLQCPTKCRQSIQGVWAGLLCHHIARNLLELLLRQSGWFGTYPILECYWDIRDYQHSCSYKCPRW